MKCVGGFFRHATLCLSCTKPPREARFRLEWWYTVVWKKGNPRSFKSNPKMCCILFCLERKLAIFLSVKISGICVMLFINIVSREMPDRSFYNSGASKSDLKEIQYDLPIYDIEALKLIKNWRSNILFVRILLLFRQWP